MKCYWLCLLTLLAAPLGCRNKAVDGGEDQAILQDITKKEIPVPARSLLPLTPGNYWDLDVHGTEKVARDHVQVIGPATVGTQAGTEVQIVRQGRLWRVEIYQESSHGLRLLAFGTNKSSLLILDPPCPITGAEVMPGQTLVWVGTITLGGKKTPASGFSRVTSKENITTRVGRLQAYRIDSVISMNRPKGKLHFPNIRWLTPGIGFVRRGYADEGKPAMADMDHYLLRGQKP